MGNDVELLRFSFWIWKFG